MSSRKLDVAVIGAGPYGLASAAHLLDAGLEIRVFGEPMEFWKTSMPQGMFLRSSWEASSIAAPQEKLDLDSYKSVRGSPFSAPVPLGNFVDYGLWFKEQVIPTVDRRRVTSVEPSSAGFTVRLADGDVWESRRVVVAGGIAPFTDRPAVFDHVPGTLASHSTNHRHFGQFASQPVAVIGGGQSAIECAVLLQEAGAEVEVIMRSDHIRWLTRGVWLRRRLSPIRSLLYPPTDVGPPALNQLVAHPHIFRLLPQGLRDRIAYRCIRPAASGWLLPRSEGLRLTTLREVVGAQPRGDCLSIQLNDGSSRTVKHALLATGFRIDITRYAFLSPVLHEAVTKVNGYPRLKRGFESSVAGLHFVGAPAAHSFGPVMRFVSGTKFTGKELIRGIAT